LEPSAGHGAIARYVPRENPLTAVEPSQSLFSKLQIKAGGNGRKFENTIFENYNVVNKHDVVLMNPPFGVGGRMAVDHVAKAFQHLDEGGRVVAIIPRGSTDKKFEKWYEEQENAVLTAEIGLPDITFERAGTNVNCRVVVIDKVTNK
ncbi:type I restriction-modification system methyltransferase subunit, partial [gut metagenome]